MKSNKLAYNKILILFSIIVISVLLTGCDKPKINNFSASPPSICLGEENSTLSWDVSGADTDMISIDPDIGAVDATGSTSVSPEETTTYTLAALNSFGITTQSVTVTVIP